MQEMIGITVAALAVAGTVLGIAFFIYDSNVQWNVREKQFATTCVVNNGSWIITWGGQGMCLGRGLAGSGKDAAP